MPIFVSFSELQREQQEAEQEYADENERIFKRLDAVQAVVANDGSTLAKIEDPEVALAKAHVKRHGAGAELEATREAAVALIAAVKRRNDRMFGVSELSKRSQRFASAVSRRYHGPASAVVALEKKSND